ncbi:hypothetical protein SLS58_005794 [Diplodia intermedia]|uniref:Ankyrin repeat protein n=1 Tax=Diplodia intermedia TaxID=856260 RepID=A0ABR3TPP7_9PEZI
MVRLLIEDFGSDPKARDGNGTTALTYAVQAGHTATARILAAVDKTAGLPPDFAAVEDAHRGPGDLTKFMCEKWFGSEKNSSVAKLQDPYQRASFMSLSTSILTHSWSVFCMLLSPGIDADMTPFAETGSAQVTFAAPLAAATMYVHTYNAPMLAALLAFGAPTEMKVPA